MINKCSDETANCFYLLIIQIYTHIEMYLEICKIIVRNGKKKNNSA